jgi:hypothetical protein
MRPPRIVRVSKQYRVIEVVDESIGFAAHDVELPAWKQLALENDRILPFEASKLDRPSQRTVLKSDGSKRDPLSHQLRGKGADPVSTADVLWGLDQGECLHSRPP